MSTAKLRVLLSDIQDPFFNLATEDWIFRDLDLQGHTLFLWRNQPTVVIGRSQNPWLECHLETMEQEQVLLARRQTGGGAVFHDLGNTNFTFLADKQQYDKTANTQIIINALKQLGVNADASGRNDIIVNINGDSRKISGSAYRETKDRAFHHGTILVNVNLERLQRYLNPNQKKLQSKGVSSVRSRVANLIDFNTAVNHQVLMDKIIESFFQYYDQECSLEWLNYDNLKKIPRLSNYYQQLQDWHWRFGQTLAFNHQLEERFAWGTVDIRLDVEHGIIKQAQIFSDSLYPEMIEMFAKMLMGRRYHKEDVEQVINLVQQQTPDLMAELEQLKQWLLQQL